MTKRAQLANLLDDLQTELDQQGLWEQQPPAPAAFDSSTPFFADTMAFSQWLQWVFIGRFRTCRALISLITLRAISAQARFAPQEVLLQRLRRELGG